MVRVLLPLCALQLAGCRAERHEETASSRASALPGAQVAPAANAPPTEGAWLDLMPSASLEGFRRVPIDALADKAVWQPKTDAGMLIVDGVGAKEMLLYEPELGDGVLHVEWRFVPAAGPKPFYNGGVYVRTPLDGKYWVQLQVAELDKPPVAGDLIAQVPGVAERVNVFQSAASPAHPVGEWNTYDIRAQGSVITLTVNGKQTVTWPDCTLARGHVGLQAEGALIEVRSLKYLAL